MRIALRSYLRTVSLAALLVLPTLALPVDDPKLRKPIPESGSGSDAQSAGGASSSGYGNTFLVGNDITVTIVLGASIPHSKQAINATSAAINATLTAFYKTVIEPANAKLDPLQGPLNVTLDTGTAGITPTDFSSWGSEAPPPSFAKLQYATVAKIVQGLQGFLVGPRSGQEVGFSGTRFVVGGNSEGVAAGAVVAKGFVRPVAGK